MQTQVIESTISTQPIELVDFARCNSTGTETEIYKADIGYVAKVTFTAEKVEVTMPPMMSAWMCKRQAEELIAHCKSYRRN